MEKKVSYELFEISGFHRNGGLAEDVLGLNFSVASHMCFLHCQL